MTAIKPIESRRVRSVAAETYPINAVCAHPDCNDESADPHHCFPRSLIGGDSYFVAITFDTWEAAVEALGKNPPVTSIGIPNGQDHPALVSSPIPHCIGLCREHHDQVEQRVAMIALIGGTYVWFEGNDGRDGNRGDGAAMVELGDLNPQPGSTRAKAKKKRFAGEARRKRKVITLRVPNDTEDGGAVYDETLERVKSKLVTEELYAEGDAIPAFEATIAAWNDWLNS